MFCIPDLFSISKAIVSLSCLITKYSVVWWYRWHRCVVGSNLMRHHNGEFSYWGHWISVAWSHISLNLLNKEKLILCSIFLTFVIKALYCSCRWLAFEECLVNADNRKALSLRWELRLINGWKDGRRLALLLLLVQADQTALAHLAAAWPRWWVQQWAPRGYKHTVPFLSFQQSLRAGVAAKLRCGWWCLGILQMEGRSCCATALTFCFQTDHLFWLCPVEIFMCMNFSAITLALLFMSIDS